MLTLTSCEVKFAIDYLTIQEIAMKIKVGVVGLGFMGSAHARVYSKLKDCKLVGICDSNPDKKHLAKAYNCNYCQDYEKFLEEQQK